jgi:hypothetical protein
MRRTLFTLSAIISLLFCLMALLLWARAGSLAASLGDSFIIHHVYLQSDSNGLSLVTLVPAASMAAASIPPGAIFMEIDDVGMYMYGPTLYIPHSFLATTFAILPAAWLWQRLRKKRPRQGFQVMTQKDKGQV